MQTNYYLVTTNTLDVDLGDYGPYDRCLPTFNGNSHCI